ncbi:MAG: transcriptional repressor [Burkholderiales bacterium]|nr:transcriptional repressor [Burkholderiales bacterium]
MSISQNQAIAEAMLRETGSRVTRGRVVVLAALLDAKRALTHSEVEAGIGRLHIMDRVTVYRVLEWLTEQGLAHRISGDDRVWRFKAQRHSQRGVHPHFQCNTCGDVVCLEETPRVPAVRLPAGFRGGEIELTVRGVCGGCAPRKSARNH